MQGLWKNKIGGLNRKGITRRKQTFKHLLKDKGNYHFKRKTQGVLHYEDEIIWTSDIPESKTIMVDIVLLAINYIDYTVTIPAMYYDDKWRALNGDRAYYHRKQEPYRFTPLHKIGTKSVEVKPYRGRDYCTVDTSYKAFMYGRPVHYRTGIYSIGAKKPCKKLANRTDRAKLKNWLSNGDWSKEIKTHSLSKSIAWCRD